MTEAAQPGAEVRDAGVAAGGAHPVAAADPAARALMMSFQPLGCSCEFGLVQRHFGAEMLSLLRFAWMPHAQLLMALRGKLHGVGEPEFTQLVLPEWSGVYYTVDTRWVMRCHTFVLKGTVDEEVLRRQRLRQLVYLRERLLSELADAEKIGLFMSKDPVSDEGLLELSDALRAFGDNKLAVMLLADEAHPHGTLRMLGEHVLVGHVGRMVVDFNTDVPDYAFWLALCQRARALWPLPEDAGA